MRRLLCAGIAAAALTIAAAAGARAPRVVLLGGAADPVVTQVRDELQVLGVEVELAPPGEARPLQEVAQARAADAAARVETWPPEIVIWIEPSDPAAAEAREIRVSDALSGPVEPGLLALRAIELLRGALIPVERRAEPGDGSAPGPHDAPAAAASAHEAAPGPDVASAVSASPAVSAAPRPAAPPPTSPARAPDRAEAIAPREPPRRFALVVGPALLAGGGGVPAALGVGLGASWDALPRLGVEVTGYAPIAPAEVAAAEGAVSLRAGLFGAGGWVRLTEPDSPLRVSIGAGLAALLLVFDGAARGPWVAQAGSRWAALPYVRAAGAYRLHPAAALRADLAVGLAQPELVVRIAGRASGSFGQPAVLLSLGLELWP